MLLFRVAHLDIGLGFYLPKKRIHQCWIHDKLFLVRHGRNTLVSGKT